MTNYLYRFLDKDGNILYIGRTARLEGRIKDHLNQSHLPSKCYKSVEKIEYLEIPSNPDVIIKEIYYINLLQPTFNRAHKFKEGSMTVFIDTSKDVWLNFEFVNPYLQNV